MLHECWNRYASGKRERGLMFRQPTVFILGAGASWHYGYPLGEDLVKKILNKAESLTAFLKDGPPQGIVPAFCTEWYGPNPKPDHWKQAQNLIADLVARLKAIDPLVIDYFLGHNPSVASLGKLLIAWVLLDCERNNPNCVNTNLAPEKRRETAHNWCRFVVHRLSAGCTEAKDLLRNQVTFVTFNYDVSLEEQLESGLTQTELFKESCAEFFTENPVIHIYGKLRDAGKRYAAPDLRRSFNPMFGNADELRHLLGQKDIIDHAFHASKGINAIDPSDKGADETALAAAKRAIQEAENIYILGFGFDRNNCNRLDLEKTSRGTNKRINFTNFGNINRVNKSAALSLTGHEDTFPPNVFVYLGSHGEKYEKSERDCYGALAYDFDEGDAY